MVFASAGCLPSSFNFIQDDEMDILVKQVGSGEFVVGDERHILF
jgi:hypothetical protein